MNSMPVVQRGVQEPRIRWIPDRVSSDGLEAVELAAHAGLTQDPNFPSRDPRKTVGSSESQGVL